MQSKNQLKLEDFEKPLSCTLNREDSELLVLNSGKEILRKSIDKKLCKAFFKAEELGLEIESKFLLKSLPENLEKPIEIEQAYLIITNNGDELRIRAKDNKKFYLSIKTGKGAVRSELNCNISKLEYEKLKEIALPRILLKKRYLRTIQESPKLTLEIDQYDEHPFGVNLRSLFIAEIEFPNLELQKTFDTKSLELEIEKEVTEDKKFSNKSIVLGGLDSISQ